MRCRGDLGGVPGVLDGGGKFHLSILTMPAGPPPARQSNHPAPRPIVILVSSLGVKMGKRMWCCVAVAVGIQAQAQTQPPKVIGVANDPWSSPTLSPGAIGYVFGSNFGALENTAITVGGLNAQVLAVSSNQIRALIPPNLPAGLATLTVTVDGQASETVNVIVSAPVPGRISSRRGSVSAGPAFRFSPTPVPEPPVYPPSFSRPLTARAPTGGGIVYTCDSTINATACNTLNTTIAALYSSAFTNANASIYVKLGSTGLGMSDYVLTDANYSTFRNLLIASESDANDVTAVTDSVPATNPFGSDQVELPNALQRALGFGTPDTGLLSDGTTFCTLGTVGCYDGVITVSNAVSLYFRSGSIMSNQYDFFTVVEHETDEILGTASCAIYGFCSGVVDPPDFFRYHSNGMRTQNAGTNNPCSSSDSTNACFSLDGVHMLQQYNNVNNGEDAGDWATNCTSPLVQDAALCGGTAGVDISPAAEILVLDVIGYTLVAVSGAVTNVTSSTPNGTYGVGASISIQITFSETVTVIGNSAVGVKLGRDGHLQLGIGDGHANLHLCRGGRAEQHPSGLHVDRLSDAQWREHRGPGQHRGEPDARRSGGGGLVELRHGHCHRHVVAHEHYLSDQSIGFAV